MMKSLGCYSEVFFSTVVDKWLVEESDVCKGCLLSDEYTNKLCSYHGAKSKTGGCELTQLLKANIMLLLFSNKDAHSKIHEELSSPNISDIIMKKYSGLLTIGTENIM